jgi:hypothetical protein
VSERVRRTVAGAMLGFAREKNDFFFILLSLDKVGGLSGEHVQ